MSAYTTIQPSDQFVRSLMAGLKHWQERTSQLNDEKIKHLDQERRNLYQVVDFGLKLPQTWQVTTIVALQSFDLVVRRGYWREWTSILENALAQGPQSAPQQQYQLLNRLGELYRLQRHMEKAIAAHERSEALAQRLNDKRAEAEAHFGLCGDYLEDRQYDKAEAYGRSALKTFTSLQVSGGWTAQTYKLLGMLARFRGECALSIDYLTQAVALGRRLGQPTRLAQLLNELAISYQADQAYDKAVDCLVEATALLDKTANELDKVDIQVNLGCIYFAQEQWAQAETAFKKANSAYLQQSGHTYSQASVANNLGNALLKQNKLEEAEGYLRQAQTLLQAVNDNLRLANTLGTLAEVLAKQNKTETAVSLYQEAIELLAAYPDDAWAQNKLLPSFREQLQALQEAEM